MEDNDYKHLKIEDDNGIIWLWDGKWLDVEGDEMEDGGYPAYSLDEVFQVLHDGGYIE